MKKSLLKSMLVALMLAMGMSVQAKNDVTEGYLVNADLSVDPEVAGNGWTLLNNWRQAYGKAEDDQHVNVVEFYAGWGSLEKTEYAMTQTIHLPSGYYRLAVNAFYRQGNDGNGSNRDKAWIFAGEKKQNVVGLAKGGISSFSGSSDLWKASNAFYKGNFSNEFDFTMEADGDIEIGFKGVFDEARCWVILGPVKLYEYTREDYIGDYRDKVAEAEKLYGKLMNAKVLAALKAAVVDESDLKTIDDITKAEKALNEAITAAKNSITAYEEIKTAIEEKIAGIDPDLDLTEMWNAYEQGLLESSADLYPMYQKIQIAALGAADGTDFTKVIINPSFEWGNTDGWTFEPSADSGARPNDNDIYTVYNADGDYVFNIWSSGNAISQTINGLPDGLYTLTALIATDADKGVVLNGNNASTLVLASEEGKAVGVDGSVEFEVLDGTATIGAEGVNKCWYKVDNFRLVLTKTYDLETLRGAYSKIVEEANGLVNKPMYSEVKSALSAATVDASTLANKEDIATASQTLNEAITAAKASIAAYEKLKAAIDKADALITEFIEHGAPESCNTVLDDIKAAYNNGTVADEEVSAKIAEINPLLLPVAKQQTKPGADMTLMLVNPDFELNAKMAEGWTINVPDYGHGNAIVGGNDFNHCFEAFNNPGFDVYQVVENAPYGVYEIQVQGFYRYLRGDNAWNAYQAQEVDYVKKQGVPVYIYMNDNSTPFTNVFAETPVANGELYSTDEALLNPGYTPPYVEPSGQYWYPNEMYNSAVAFSAGMYKQSAYGLVAFDGDVLRLGVKGVSNQGDDSWVIWDDFKLIYRGFQPDIIKPVLEEAVKDVEDTYIGLLMGKTEYAAFTTALDDAEKAIAENDGEGMFKALRALYAAKEPALKSKDIFLAQEVAADTARLAQAIRDVAEAKMAKTTRANANTLLNGLQNNLIYENDQIDQLKQDVTGMIEAMNNSIALYTEMKSEANNLREIIANVKKDLPQLKVLDDATKLCDDADSFYETGDKDDDDMPAYIEEIKKMKQRLFEYQINYLLMKVELENLSSTLAKAEAAGVDAALISQGQGMYNAGLAAFNAGEMGRGDMADEAKKIADFIEELEKAIVATGINAVTTTTNDSPVYNMGGQKVKTQKGLVITNGKKVVK